LHTTRIISVSVCVGLATAPNASVIGHTRHKSHEAPTRHKKSRTASTKLGSETLAHPLVKVPERPKATRPAGLSALGSGRFEWAGPHHAKR
jgi:hypothetical protein